jgi:hypothetical protein
MIETRSLPVYRAVFLSIKDERLAKSVKNLEGGTAA